MFGLNLCYKVCGFNYKFDLFLLISSSAQILSIAKFTPRSILILLRFLFAKIKQNIK